MNQDTRQTSERAKKRPPLPMGIEAVVAAAAQPATGKRVYDAEFIVLLTVSICSAKRAVSGGFFHAIGSAFGSV
ncbi:hypothetical protein [Mycolicibacterium sp.]|uniref:hypothetical protein n=1 Tax=Mycolicibacterium sp. TaxID=2320850 RepID=UPI0028AD47AF|nr:hypothetical protein [Mycolicibacterium sp.]